VPNLRPDPRNHPPTAQVGSPNAKGTPAREEPDWLELARSAFYGSTAYTDANYRKAWEDSIRAFNNQHPSDSKYSQPAYEKRSRVFRPKTRAVIRKNEAAAAAAFFSNMDVVSVTAQNQSSKAEAASADVMKELLQYRLTKSIPWYQIVLGGLQDAQVTGVVCAHVHWEYEDGAPVRSSQGLSTPQEEQSESEEQAGRPEDSDTEFPEQTNMPLGSVFASKSDGLKPADKAASVKEDDTEDDTDHKPRKPQKDKPSIDLVPVENIRVDPGASWIDPINTSPYVIHLMPLYVLDVKARMKRGDWFELSDAEIGAATELRVDSTRSTRNTNRDDPYGQDNTSISDYTIVWVQRHIHKRNGQDWEFYTMGDVAMLSDPIPLAESVFTGVRPYVMGCCIIETHKIMPSSVPQLGKGLQDETNEIANQRIDNIKFVLNKKWFVKRGREADVAGLVRNVPGGVVMLDDPEKDVREVTWPDVTASSFQEHQGISMEMDELLGNFNPAAIMAAGAHNSPAKNMAMLSNSQGTLVEYLIRTYVETFVQPVLRMLVKLEQQYETDAVLLKIANKRANVVQRFGMDEDTDLLLDNELTLNVNVGMGATDPMQKLQKFLMGMAQYTMMLKQPTPGLNMPEIGKEIFGLLGYADGTRFFVSEDPQVNVLQQQLQKSMQMIQALQTQVKEKQTGHQVKLVASREKNQAEMAKAQLHEKEENKRALATHFRALMESHQGREHERSMRDTEQPKTAANWQ